MTLLDPTILLYLEVLVVAFLVNLVPAFAPPTWIVLCLYQLNNPQLNILGLAGFGVVGSVTGRYGMYLYSKFFGKYVPKKQANSLSCLAQFAGGKRKTVLFGSFLYALSPLPSNFLFIASGLSFMRVLPLLAGFAFGRVISYASLAYVSSTLFSLAGVGNVWYGRLVVDILGVAGGFSIVLINWERTLQKLRRTFRLPAVRTAPIRP
jgi:hypothetical protein